MKRILFSARDPAAALAIKNIVDHLIADRSATPYIICSGPAISILSSCSCEVFKLFSDDLLNDEVLISKIQDVYQRCKLDAVVVGSSGPDAGIDEYLLKELSFLPRYVIQDFWGDVNLTLGVEANCYFVLDDFAKKLTMKKVSADVDIVGSVKNQEYSELNHAEIRAVSRLALGLNSESDVLIGFYGMPLGHLKGYWETIKLFSSYVEGSGYKVLYRPHPKEDMNDIRKTKKELSSCDFIYDPFEVVEESLLACDYCFSCFSSCGIDSELLNHHFPIDKRATSIFLLFNKEICDLYKDYTGLNDLPISTQGRSISIFDEARLDEIFKLISRKISLGVKQIESLIVKNSKSYLPSKLILDRVLTDISARTGE